MPVEQVDPVGPEPPQHPLDHTLDVRRGRGDAEIWPSWEGEVEIRQMWDDDPESGDQG